MRYAISISYDGSNYHGWQRQAPGIATVQQELEDQLARLLGIHCHITGCGRTDTGVHASAYFAHVDIPDQHLVLDAHAWNTLLPSDIRIVKICEAPQHWHAQRSATARTYTYRIATENNAERASTVGQYGHLSLDYSLLQKVTALYANAEDFQAFCRKANQYKHTICRIDECSVSPCEEYPELIFTVTANRFLQNMVRLLVARMIDVGKGSTTIQEVELALNSGIPFVYQRPAYANGLTLSQVKYAVDPFA